MWTVLFGTMDEDGVQFDNDGPEFDTKREATAYAKQASRCNEVYQVVKTSPVTQ